MPEMHISSILRTKSPRQLHRQPRDHSWVFPLNVQLRQLHDRIETVLSLPSYPIVSHILQRTPAHNQLILQLPRLLVKHAVPNRPSLPTNTFSAKSRHLHKLHIHERHPLRITRLHLISEIMQHRLLILSLCLLPPRLRCLEACRFTRYRNCIQRSVIHA